MREENYISIPAACGIFHGASLYNTEEKEEICFTDRVLSELFLKKTSILRYLNYCITLRVFFRFGADI